MVAQQKQLVYIKSNRQYFGYDPRIIHSSCHKRQASYVRLEKNPTDTIMMLFNGYPFVPYSYVISSRIPHRYDLFPNRVNRTTVVLFVCLNLWAKRNSPKQKVHPRSCVARHSKVRNTSRMLVSARLTI